MFRTYDKYKEVGVEWIGEIPSHWSLKRIGYISKLLTGNPWKSELFNFESGVPIVRGENVSEGFLRWGSRGRYWDLPIEENSPFYLKEGDIIIGMDGSKVGKNYVIIKKEDLPLLLHQRMCRIRVGNQYSSSFLNYWIGSEMFRYYINISKTDPMVPHITQKNIFDFKVPFPEKVEQHQIVTFLDKKTALIDSLIEKTQRKIELLKEKRTSLINEVVTKGLNPDVELKDSGVEWIGEIPSHWDVKKLKFVSDIVYGISPPDTTYNDEGVGTILINGPVEYSESDFGYTRSLKWTTAPKKFTKNGSLLFCLRGSTTGRMNITHTDVSIGRGVCSIISNENQWYLIYSMFSVRRWIQGQISGSTFPSVTSDEVNNYQICSPPLNEQYQIVEYLDNETQLIDKTISNEEKRIELLEEYRQSLISEVVTGKVKVTTWT